jgi:hypothetical protein
VEKASDPLFPTFIVERHVEQLDGDLLLKVHVARGQDQAHATFADDALDAVLPGDQVPNLGDFNRTVGRSRTRGKLAVSHETRSDTNSGEGSSSERETLQIQ